nr:restriction endonuclease subunit S [uncultured Bacteroides sp.]
MDRLQSFTKEICGFDLTPFSGGSKFRNGDTLLARITPCLENGKTAKVSVLNDGEIGFGSTEFIVLRGIKNVTDNDFVYYYVLNPSFRDIAIKSMVGSSGRQRVQQSVLENLEINLPPLHEQIKIATILSSLDDKIKLNNKINDNLEKQAQAIFKSWFVDFEPFQYGEFVNSELGMIPKGWRIDSIYRLIDVIYGAPYKSSFFNIKKDGRPLIRIRDLKTNNPQFYSPEILPNTEYVKSGDIVAGMDAEFIPYIWQGEMGLLNQRVCKFRAKAEFICNYFIYFILKPHLNFLQFHKVGTTVSHMGKSDIDRIKIIIPPNNILAHFAKVTTPIFNESLNRSKQNINLINLRDSLLPKLMSGELSVEDI